MSIDSYFDKKLLLPLAAALICAAPAYSAPPVSPQEAPRGSEYELRDWRQMFERPSLEACGDHDLLECYATDVVTIDSTFLQQRCDSEDGPYALEIRGSRKIDAEVADVLRQNGMEVLQLRRADGTTYQATAPRAFVFCKPEEYYDAMQRGIIRDYTWLLDMLRSVQP
jgi:hypothetical protein